MAKGAQTARSDGGTSGSAARLRSQPAPDFGETYLELLSLVERLHRLLLDVLKDEFERLGLLAEPR